MQNYFTIIQKDIPLLTEHIYGTIMWKSDKYVSHITRQRICDITGLNDVDTVSKHTSILEREGLLKKIKNPNNGKLIEYHLTKPTKNFTLVSNNVFSLNPDIVGFLLRLSYLRYNGTTLINLTDKEIVKRLKINIRTFDKLRDESINQEALFKTEWGYCLSTEYFPITKQITEQQREIINGILQMDDTFKGKKVLLYYYKNDFRDLKMDLKDFLNYCLAGCPGIRKNPPTNPNEYDL